MNSQQPVPGLVSSAKPLCRVSSCATAPNQLSVRDGRAHTDTVNDRVVCTTGEPVAADAVVPFNDSALPTLPGPQVAPPVSVAG
ncbi:hypothetical protein GCM10009558_007740 [Virgisporangium aurantiacum]